MKLIDVVTNLLKIDDQLTIYATKPWSCDSFALLAREPDAGGLPTEAEGAGMDYFIEVFVAKEFLEDWADNERRSVPPQEKCERLIYYAIYDS